MSAVKVWCRCEVEIDGQVHSLGRRHTDAPYLISVDGNVTDRQRDVSTQSSVTLFDIDNDIGDFDFMAIEADQNVIVELTIDKGGENGTEYDTVALTGGVSGRPGPPLILARDDGYANYTASFSGTLDVIDRVKVYNESASDTAHVRLIAVT